MGKKICERLKAKCKRVETKDWMMRDMVTDKVILQIASQYGNIASSK
jgi:hypothetical protein